MTLAPGTRLGRYEVRRLLGTGGMGEVYAAYDGDLEREVAIKVIREDAPQSSDRMRRFVQEAKVASGLHHPNVAHIYEIGSDDGLRFISMELIEGETLRDRLGRGAIPIDEILSIATQVAAALAAAHRAGVVHRDIKPENVIITADGYAKVLDFGLAKLRETAREQVETVVKTASGVAMGTLHYMAPEQLVGGEVTAAADVFSFGVLLYEALAGHRPFDGISASEVATAILTKSPPPVLQSRSDTPPRLNEIVTKALAKDPAGRQPDGGALHAQLLAVSRQVAVMRPEPARLSRSATWIGLGLLVILAAIVAGGMRMVRLQRERGAAETLARAEALLRERRWPEAYEAATAALAVLPSNARLHEIITHATETITIESDPPGATIYLQRYKGPPQRVRAGITPLTIARIPRSDYLLTLEKSGYAAAVLPISATALNRVGDPMASPRHYRVKLSEEARTPPGMVLVEGGSYRLNASYRASDRIVELRDFFIDRYEVSNRDFDAFIRAGGYRRPEFWKHRFVDGSQTLSFEQAMARFRDATGLPGPRRWSGGAPPAGKENHPVTDVTWYEAAAFAEWKGKKLPSIYQWEKAGRHPSFGSTVQWLPWGAVGQGEEATERANFAGSGTKAVDSMPFGASPSGAYHMAGNVAEWCRNPNPPGFAARGGGWKDAVYAFGQTAAYPGFYSSAALGFRCVKGGGGDEGDFALSPSGFVPVYKPAGDAEFEQYRRRYEYRHDPLNARVVERVETPAWTRETVTFQVGGRTVPAYLYLPRGFPRPLQVIHFFPAGDVVRGRRSLAQSIEVQWAPLIRSGRAIFAVALEGFLDRPHPADWVMPERHLDEYVDMIVGNVTEIRRGLDYLETRPEIDATRIGLLGISAGGGPGVFASALESRYRSVALIGTGIAKDEEQFAPAACRIHFVPRMRAAKLMFHGLYDEDTSLESEAKPMFRLMAEPKRLQTFEGGHIPALDLAVRELTGWFDETMGRVR